MAGWHCSSCFATMADLKNKIMSFSHKVYNHPYILDDAKLLSKVRRGKDLFERKGEIYDRVDGNVDVPGYLRNNESLRERFGYMLDRDAGNAGFGDM